MCVHHTHKVGCFFKMVKILHFGYFITHLVKNLRQGSLYDVIKNILTFILNAKQPLSDIWLLSFEQISFGVFLKTFKFRFFQKHQKQLCLDLNNQISVRGCFVFKTNGRIFFITSYKDPCHSFFNS